MNLIRWPRAALRALESFLKALDHADYNPVAGQQRRIASLEERLARLEVGHGKG